MVTEDEIRKQGYEKPGKENLWTKDGDWFYLREGAMRSVRGVPDAELAKFWADPEKVPPEARAIEGGAAPPMAPEPSGARMKPRLDKWSGSKIATINELKGEEYQKARDTLERIDEQLIEAELAGEVVEKFVYSFTGAGRTVQGLTWPGVRFIAKRVGKIEMETMDTVESPDSWIVKVRAVDRKSGVAMFGLAQQSKNLRIRDGRTQPDPFSLEKCSSRAMRNAMRNLIPEQESIVLLNRWLKEAKNGAA